MTSAWRVPINIGMTKNHDKPFLGGDFKLEQIGHGHKPYTFIFWTRAFFTPVLQTRAKIAIIHPCSIYKGDYCLCSIISYSVLSTNNFLPVTNWLLMYSDTVTPPTYTTRLFSSPSVMTILWITFRLIVVYYWGIAINDTTRFFI